jgi:hypothetical protein
MESSLVKLTQKYIQKYQESIKSEYPAVDTKILQKLWSELNIVDGKKVTIETKPLKKKKTAYQRFFVEARQRLTEKNPTLKFGEISKLVSNEWASMTSEEKKKFDQSSETTNTVEEKKYNDDCFIDFFEKNSCEKEDFRFELGNDTVDEDSIVDDELEEEVDEEDEVYFDEENTFEMDD